MSAIMSLPIAALVCYESPCGVMRATRVTPLPVALSLRIPMRGYEELDMEKSQATTFVTNPHAGL